MTPYQKTLLRLAEGKFREVEHSFDSQTYQTSYETQLHETLRSGLAYLKSIKMEDQYVPPIPR